MHGPPLSPDEVVAYVRRAVGHLKGLGVGREEAIGAAAFRYGVPRERIACLVGEPALAHKEEE